MVYELQVAKNRCFWCKKPISPTLLRRYCIISYMTGVIMEGDWSDSFGWYMDRAVSEVVLYPTSTVASTLLPKAVLCTPQV